MWLIVRMSYCLNSFRYNASGSLAEMSLVRFVFAMSELETVSSVQRGCELSNKKSNLHHCCINNF